MFANRSDIVAGAMFVSQNPHRRPEQQGEADEELGTDDDHKVRFKARRTKSSDPKIFPKTPKNP